VIAARYCLLVFLLALSACAGSGAKTQPDSDVARISEKARSIPMEETTGVTLAKIDHEGTSIYGEVIGEPFTESPVTAEESAPIIDRTQKTVYTVVNSSSLWFDSFFGSTNAEQVNNVSRGSLTLGAQWDQRDGVDPIARMKARIPLDALRERTRLMFGRVNVNEFVDGSADDAGQSLPSQFNDFEDDDWLLGVGYSRNDDLSSGFDFDVGVRIAKPLEPYVRTTYRWNHTFSDAALWQLRPRVFWQNQRGFGASVNSIFDYAVNPKWLLRSWVILSTEDEIEGLGWTNNFIAYQSLTNKTALSYKLFASGETDNDVELQDYGIELRYRKRVSRDFLFMEVSTSLSWPRYFLEETRESNLGVGLAFEMQFGDWPGRKQDKRTDAGN
jgi:hypothetical protein